MPAEGCTQAIFMQWRVISHSSIERFVEINAANFRSTLLERVLVAIDEGLWVKMGCNIWGTDIYGDCSSQKCAYDLFCDVATRASIFDANYKSITRVGFYSSIQVGVVFDCFKPMHHFIYLTNMVMLLNFTTQLSPLERK
jgi:hypothetical protein